jgi:hypothetical protein
MKKEYDTDSLTPENAWQTIEKYLTEAKVGSVEFIAFCDVLECRQAKNLLEEKMRLVEIVKSGEKFPQKYNRVHKSLDEMESELRIAEHKTALNDVVDRKYESMVPGYFNASIYAQELIQAHEEYNVDTVNYNIEDPVLEKLRRIGAAHEGLTEYTMVEIKGQSNLAEGNWLIGLLKSLGK